MKLTLVSSLSAPARGCSVLFDEYVPVKFSSGIMSGQIYVRIGTLTSSMLEIGLDSQSGRLTKATLVTHDAAPYGSLPDQYSCLVEIPELPALDVEALEHVAVGRPGSRYVDLTTSLKVCVSGGRILVEWDFEEGPSVSYAVDRARFYFTGQGTMCAIGFVELKEEEQSLFLSHLPSETGGKPE